MIFNSINDMIITMTGSDTYEVKVLKSKREPIIGEKINRMYGLVRKPLLVNDMIRSNLHNHQYH